MPPACSPMVKKFLPPPPAPQQLRRPKLILVSLRNLIPGGRDNASRTPTVGTANTLAPHPATENESCSDFVTALSGSPATASPEFCPKNGYSPFEIVLLEPPALHARVPPPLSRLLRQGGDFDHNVRWLPHCKHHVPPSSNPTHPPIPPIHLPISAIEFIPRQLGSKPLRPGGGSDSLFAGLFLWRSAGILPAVAWASRPRRVHRRRSRSIQSPRASVVHVQAVRSARAIEPHVQ